MGEDTFTRLFVKHSIYLVLIVKIEVKYNTINSLNFTELFSTLSTMT